LSEYTSKNFHTPALAFFLANHFLSRKEGKLGRVIQGAGPSPSLSSSSSTYKADTDSS
jgi:hypothetical protein